MNQPIRPRADRARQVAEVLRRQVAAGAFPSGVLPDERHLVADFGATRNAVREALRTLGDEGLVQRRRGIGTVVLGRPYGHGLGRLTGLAETLHEHGPVTNEVREARTVRAPGAVAHRLGLPPGAEVVYLERLRRLAGRPLSLDLTYLTPDIGGPLLTADLAARDVFALIEEQTGGPLEAAEIAVQAVTADPPTATALEATDGAALLSIERLSRLSGGRPVDLEYLRIRGDRLTLHAELPRT